MKILWVSRHAPLGVQKRSLEKIFKEPIDFKFLNSFKNAEEIVKTFKEEGCQEMVVVAPLSVIMRLTELGVKPLFAEMSLCAKEVADTEVAGRHYRFLRFRRIKEVKIIFEEI
jgi:hypothetical protein